MPGGLMDLLIIPLAFVAFIVKSVASFGPGILMLPLGMLLFGAKTIVVVVGVLDWMSNGLMLVYRGERKDDVRASHWLESEGNERQTTNKGQTTKGKGDEDVRLSHGWASPSHFQRSMMTAMVVGSVMGAAVLAMAPLDVLAILFGLVLIPLGVSFVLVREVKASGLRHVLPERASLGDLCAGLAAGGLGGLVGITGPALAWRFGQTYAKHAFRSLMIPLLFASACARVVTYSLGGVLTAEVFYLVALSLPGLCLGLVIGQRLFVVISEVWLRRIIGTLIAASGVRLLS